jgi:septal ring factor EnvC (AmiA/AmiB activator)
MKGKLRSTKSAQKELSQLTQTQMQQSQELKELKKQQKNDEESIATLRRELTEKKRSTASLHERVSLLNLRMHVMTMLSYFPIPQTKTLRSENQELQKAR